MDRNVFVRSILFALLTVFTVAGAHAQTQPVEEGREPYVGQAGKDVIWLPAELEMVEKMLDIAKVTPADTVVDLGSGDGRTVIGAAKRGARGIGVELDPVLLATSRRAAEREGVADRATFVQQDLFEFDLSRASVITLFLLDTINLRLRPKLLGLAPGTRVVSNTFTLGEWTRDDAIRDESKPGCSFNCVAYLWVVPAKVEGVWRLPQGTLTMKQEYQELTGTLDSGGGQLPVAGRVRGNKIRLTVRGGEYVGRVNGDAIEGTQEVAGTRSTWSAKRAGD